MEDLSQSRKIAMKARLQVYDSRDGEMSEWLKEHAWKLTPAGRADAHQIPPTHSRSTTSRNNDVHQRVPVNDRVAPGFRGVCDTVLTQCEFPLASDTHGRIRCRPDAHSNGARNGRRDCRAGAETIESDRLITTRSVLSIGTARKNVELGHYTGFLIRSFEPTRAR
jgi:hypothetical protein